MKWISLICITMLFFLFVGGPDSQSHRVFQQIWDMGHIFLFATLTYIAMETVFFKRLSIIKSFLYLILLSLVLGLIIEVLQVFVGRNFEFKDLVSDILGTVIGFLIAVYFERRYIFNKQLINLFFIVILCLVSSLRLIIVLFDEVNIRHEFPILVDNSSLTQLTRWDVFNASLSLTNEIPNHGNMLLSVFFLPGKYPDITLQHFMGDWTGYKYISFRLFNPKLKPLDIELKIYDQAHTQNKYSDRFNMVIQLKNGWNEIKIPLIEVKNSPIKRKMDLSKIKSLSLFLNNLTQPVKLYLSPIELI